MLNFEKLNGLLPVIAQEHQSGQILMQAFVNKEALKLSVASNQAHYFSRTKNRIWKKGETSGHVQNIKEILVDCDNDSLIFKIEQIGGAACHRGYKSCFYRKYTNENLEILKDAKKVFDPKEVY